MADGDGPAGGPDARERWLAAVERLVTVPEGFREEVVDRVAALDLLRCGEATLDALVAAGLPCSGTAGTERYDRYDLFNLALDSGSGTSVPERALSFALRWMSGEPSTWVRPARWSFDIEIACAEPDGCGREPRWTLARPQPEISGGRTWDLTVRPAAATLGPVDVAAAGSGGLAISASLETRGRQGEFRSTAVRELVGDFMSSGLRWVRLPEPVQWRADEVLARGVAPCISACLRLQRELHRAGYEARTRRGWILGMLDLAHAWLEVTDDDGVVKAVDPIFALLSGHAPAPHPVFAGACLGWRFNRLLPTGHAADQPLAGHHCGGRPAALRQRTDVRTDRSTALGASLRTLEGAQA